MEHLTERALADQLEDFKVFWSESPLVGFLETEPELDISSYLLFATLCGLELEPSLMGSLVIFKDWAETNVAKERLVILFVVD